MIRFAIAGTGKMPLDIARAISETDGAAIVCTLSDPEKERSGSGLETLGKPHASISRGWKEASALLEEAKPDYFLNVNNFCIVPASTLRIAKLGTINFHNGPLPRYAGLNPCSWAILRGESAYGVTWHFVEPGIDTGPILDQAHFELEGTETALELIIQCIEVGIDLFKNSILPMLLLRQTVGVPQLLKQREYFSGKDLPFQGFLPWWQPYEELERYVRAMTFAPLPNMYFRPRIKFRDGSTVCADQIGLEERTSPGVKGMVTVIDDNSVAISVDRGAVILEELYSPIGDEISALSLPNLDVIRPDLDEC